MEPDGHFPHHIPNPENAEAMQSLVDAVIRHNADFGLIFDTDVDRVGAVDKGGVVLNKDPPYRGHLRCFCSVKRRALSS